MSDPLSPERLKQLRDHALAEARALTDSPMYQRAQTTLALLDEVERLRAQHEGLPPVGLRVRDDVFEASGNVDAIGWQIYCEAESNNAARCRVVLGNLRLCSSMKRRRSRRLCCGVGSGRFDGMLWPRKRGGNDE